MDEADWKGGEDYNLLGRHSSNKDNSPFLRSQNSLDIQIHTLATNYKHILKKQKETIFNGSQNILRIPFQTEADTSIPWFFLPPS